MKTTLIQPPARQSGIFKIGGETPVLRLGFGAMRLTGKGIWGEPEDPAECIAVLRRAVDLGINFIDTADSYGPFVSERLIAQALHPYPKGVVIATVQNLYNLVERRSEDVLNFCTREGIGFIPWFPLATGTLANPGSPLESAARELGATPGQVALAWLLKKSPVMLPIPGTSSVDHLETNALNREKSLSIPTRMRRRMIPIIFIARSHKEGRTTERNEQ